MAVPTEGAAALPPPAHPPRTTVFPAMFRVFAGVDGGIKEDEEKAEAQKPGVDGENEAQ